MYKNDIKVQYSKEEELELGKQLFEMREAREALESGKHFSANEVAAFNHTIAIGETAKEKLVIAYTPMVHQRANSAKKAYPGGLPLEDLVQEGMAGLVRGLNRFDYRRGNKVSTVVMSWIRQGITRWNNTNGRLVRLPENRVDSFIKINRLREEFKDQGLPQHQIDEKIMEVESLSPEYYYATLNAAAMPTSLNRTVSSESSSERELIDFIMTDNAESSEETVMKETVMSILTQCLDSLTVMQQDIIASSFMLDNYEAGNMKAKDVQAMHGISPAKYKKELQLGLNEIKSSMESSGMDFTDFLDL